MNRTLTVSAAALALVFAPAAMAKQDEVAQQDEGESQADNAEMEAAPAGEPVRLISWDGDFELMKTSRRMRVWRSHLAYTLTVDAAGTATGCEFTEAFRMRRVSDSLCEVLMEHHTFEPAHDATGTAVEGSYSARISYRDVQERL